MAYTPQIYYPQNNYSNYQQNYPQIPQQIGAQMPIQQPQQTQSSNSGLIWVTGEVGAKSYLVAPNQSVLLMDSEGDRFYLKTTDSAGMPTLRTFEYKEVLQNTQQIVNKTDKSLETQYVTREEYNALNNKYDELVARLEEIQKPKTAKRKEVVENE